MPEASAQLTPPVPEQKPIDVEARLDGIRAGVGQSSDQAMGNTGRPHDPVPKIEQKPELPPQVPVDGSTHKTLEDREGSLDVPGSFKSEPDNNFRHFVDITGGNNGAPPRTGKASEVIDLQKAKGEKVLAHGNQGSGQPGVLRRIGTWFLKEKRAA